MKIQIGFTTIEHPDRSVVLVDGHSFDMNYHNNQQEIADSLQEMCCNASYLRQRYEDIEELQDFDTPIHRIMNLLKIEV